MFEYEIANPTTRFIELEELDMNSCDVDDNGINIGAKGDGDADADGDVDADQLDHYTIVQNPRHKTSSCVWKYFGHLKKNNVLIDEKHVYCTKCFDESKTKKYQKSTSTGNLIKHLKKAHNVTDQPSYRIKQEHDRLVVTKEESPPFDIDDGEVDYYLDGTTDSLIHINGTGANNNIRKSTTSESDNNDFYIHDINELLIQEIYKRPLIYDTNSTTKNRAQIRRNLWAEIYEALNHCIEHEKLPKIWKNIRDRYQKIKKDMDRDGRTSKPRYRYYDMLRFLDDVDCGGNAEENDKMASDNYIFMDGDLHLLDTDNIIPPNTGTSDDIPENQPPTRSPMPTPTISINVNEPQCSPSVSVQSSIVDVTMPNTVDNQLHLIDLDDDCEIYEDDVDVDVDEDVEDDEDDVDDVDDDEEEEDDDDDDEEDDEDEDYDVDVDEVMNEVDLLSQVDDNQLQLHHIQRSREQQQQQQQLHLLDIDGVTDDVVDISNMQPITLDELSAHVKEEMYNMEPLVKKVKIDRPVVHIGVTDADLSPAPSGRHRDLMTPDNIASLLIEQHQHELLCHQQQQQQLQQHEQQQLQQLHQHQQHAIDQSPPSQSLPVASWQLSTHNLADTLDVQHPQSGLLPVASPPSDATPVSVMSLSPANNVAADMQSNSVMNGDCLQLQQQGISLATLSSSVTDVDVSLLSPATESEHDLLAGATITILSPSPMASPQHQQHLDPHMRHHQQQQQPRRQHQHDEFQQQQQQLAELQQLSNQLNTHLTQQQHQQQQQQHDDEQLPVVVEQPAVSTTQPKPTSPTQISRLAQFKCNHSSGASEEYTIFGTFVAEVMRNMDKPRARLLQMRFMKLISDLDEDDQQQQPAAAVARPDGSGVNENAKSLDLARAKF